MVPYRYDPEHIAPANAAPRCQHIKLSGHRCGAPARRRRRFCRFHQHILNPKPGVSSIPYVEDAASLQDAIMQVLRLIHSPRPDYKACGLSLYALQLACTNLRNFKEEQAALEPQEEVAIDEVSDDESPATEEAGEEEASEEAEAETETEQEQEPGTLAELLQSLVAKERGGDRKALPPAGAVLKEQILRPRFLALPAQQTKIGFAGDPGTRSVALPQDDNRIFYAAPFCRSFDVTSW